MELLDHFSPVTGFLANLDSVPGAGRQVEAMGANGPGLGHRLDFHHHVEGSPGDSEHVIYAHPKGVPFDCEYCRTGNEDYHPDRSKFVGHFAWNNDSPRYEPGEITALETHPALERRGIATAMFEHAQRFDPPPVHSADRTDAGDEWAHATGHDVPEMSGSRNYEEFRHMWPEDEGPHEHTDLLRHFQAAARPGRGEKQCPCCGGRGEHGDGSECHPCDGQGIVHANEPDEYCPGQPRPRRRHWREPRTAATGPAAERTESVAHMLAHYAPTDFDTWDEVRDNHHWDHPKMRAFVDDVRRNGVRRPIPVDYGSDPPRVMNGHTRLLVAEKAGRETVPTRQHDEFMDPDDPDPQGCHSSIEEHEQASPNWQHEASAEPQAWYHATPEELEPGTVLRPGDEVGKQHMGRGSDSSKLWVSSDPWRASSYGLHIYEVRPHSAPKAVHAGSDEHHTTTAEVLREVPYREATEISPAYQEGVAAYAKQRALQAEGAADMIDLYHHTDPAAAAKIYREKRMTSKENTGSVFFTTDPESEYAAGFGEGEVHVRMPRAHLDRLVDRGKAWQDDEFPSGEQHWAIHHTGLKPEHFVGPGKTAVVEHFAVGWTSEMDDRGSNDACPDCGSGRFLWVGSTSKKCSGCGMVYGPDLDRNPPAAFHEAAAVEDYGMQMRPGVDGPPLHDLTDSSETDWGMPHDVYDNLRMYDAMYDSDRESVGHEHINKIRKFRGQPDKRVRIWRSAPAVNPESRNAKRGEINHGDWIALDRAKAISEGREVNDSTHGSLSADHPARYHLWTALVPAKHVRNAGGDLTEWGYSGPDIKNLTHSSERCDHRPRVQPVQHPYKEASTSSDSALEIEFRTAKGKRRGIAHETITAYVGGEKAGHARMIDHGTGLDDLYVKPEHRGKGVGHALMNEVVSRYGHNTLALFASPFTQGKKAENGLDRDQLQKFYESHGFERGPFNDGSNYMERRPPKIEATAAAEPQDGPYVVYHGTHHDSADSIQQHGLERRGDDWTVTTSRDGAGIHANMRDWTEPKVVEIHVPRDQVSSYLGEPFDATEGTVHALKRSLPAEWVKAVHTAATAAHFGEQMPADPQIPYMKPPGKGAETTEHILQYHTGMGHPTNLSREDLGLHGDDRHWQRWHDAEHQGRIHESHQHLGEVGTPGEKQWPDTFEPSEHYYWGNITGERPAAWNPGNYGGFHPLAPAEGALVQHFAATEPEYGPRPEWDHARYEAEGSPYADKMIGEEKAWKGKIQHGLSVGHLTEDRARELGYHPSGHATSNGGWQALPQEMYHVTTDLPGVREHGLRTREELAQHMQGGHGLGGGESDTVSLTTDKTLAHGILDSLHEYHHVLNHVPPHELFEAAKRGEGASRPYYDDMVKAYNNSWEHGDPLPESVDALMRGKHSDRHILGGRTDEEMATEGWQPSPHPHNYRWTAPKGNFSTLYERDVTPAEELHNRSYAYKMFARVREHAGGREDPMFFTNDEQGFAAKDPSKFALLHVSPKSGAQGYRVGGMSEWRTGTGDALEVHHAEQRHGSQLREASLQAEAAADDSLSWDQIGERHPGLYGDPEIHGEAAEYGDGEGVGAAVAHLMYDRPGHPETDSTGENHPSSTGLRFYPRTVDTSRIDYMRHDLWDPRVQEAKRGYQTAQGREEIPPSVLVHRHGIFYPADGHHRAQGSEAAHWGSVRAYVAYSPHDEPFSSGERGPYHGASTEDRPVPVMWPSGERRRISHPGFPHAADMGVPSLGSHTAGLDPQAARIIPLENPHTHGTEWYHGSPHRFADFGDEMPDEMFDDGGTGEPEPEDHWNTLLGHHFAASHELAHEFAKGDHPNNTYYPEGGPQEHLMHAHLHLRNPRRYASEHDMDQEVYEHEWRAGNHISKHLDPELAEYHEQGSDVGPEYDYKDDHERLRPASESDSHYRKQVHPYATGWLTVHPDKWGIAERFKQRLRDQGHDGIVYGNEFEGQKYGKTGRTCAIAFDEGQIGVTQHHTGQQCLSHEDAARQHPPTGQQMLPFHEGTLVAHFEQGASAIKPADFMSGVLQSGHHGMGDEDAQDLHDVLEHIRLQKGPGVPINDKDARVLARSFRGRDRMEQAGYQIAPHSKEMKYPRGFGIDLPNSHRLTLVPEHHEDGPNWYARIDHPEYPMGPRIEHTIRTSDEELPGEVRKFLDHPDIQAEMDRQLAEGKRVHAEIRAENEAVDQQHHQASVHHVASSDGRPYVPPPQGHEDLMGHLGEHHGVAYSGDKAPSAAFLEGLHGQFHAAGAPHQHEDETAGPSRDDIISHFFRPAPAQPKQVYRPEPERLDEREYLLDDVSKRYDWEGFAGHEIEHLVHDPEHATFTHEDVPVQSLRQWHPDGRLRKPITYKGIARQGKDERDRLAEVERGMEAGAVPPIVVARDGEHHIIADGSHRSAIAAERGHSHIEAFVTDRTIHPGQHQAAAPPPEMVIASAVADTAAAVVRPDSAIASWRPEGPAEIRGMLEDLRAFHETAAASLDALVGRLDETPAAGEFGEILHSMTTASLAAAQDVADTIGRLDAAEGVWEPQPGHAPKA